MGLRSVDNEMAVDIRRMHLNMLANAIFKELEDLVDDRRELHERIFAALARNGAMIISDNERAKLGLEERDEKGWTFSEKIEQKRRIHEATLSVFSPILPVK